MKNPGRIFAICFAMLAASLLALPGAGRAQAGYKAYAMGLVKAPPKGARFRPDLEAYLNARASAARRKQGLRGLKAGGLMRIAARAQALDMALGGYVGHGSRRGDGFTVRFAAFAGGLRGHRGENAARNRRHGPVNAAKAGQLFAQWLDSAGHKSNLMRPHYRFVSTGAVQLGRHLYAVQIFWGALAKSGIKFCTTPLIC